MPEVVAVHSFVKRLNDLDRISIRDAMLASHLANAPKQWDIMLKRGLRFSAVPVNVDAIRKTLGITDEHTVIVAPVFSGEWSKIHPAAIGIDFSEEALRNHPNPYRIKADLRELPLPDNYADHVVSYEPTPLHTGTATVMDVLMTLHEFSRVGKSVHIIQRHGKIAPVWTYPFVQHYLASLGVPYTVKDLTEHVSINTMKTPIDRIRVVAVSFKGSDVMAHRNILVSDIGASYRFLKTIAKQGKLTPGSVRALLRFASPALRKAFTEQYLLSRKPRRRLRRGKRP